MTGIELAKDLAAGVGFLVIVLSLIGGLLSLPRALKQFKWDMSRPGARGMGCFVLRHEDKQEWIEVTFLVTEDLMHFLKAFAGEGKPGTVHVIKSVGEYYEVVLRFPPDADLRFFIVDKKGRPKKGI